MKRTQYLIGVDIGTQGTKALLFDRQGRPLTSAFRRSRLYQPAPGVVEEDPADQFQAVCWCIRTCLRKAKTDPSNVAAVGIDGQMAGILGLGEEGRHVTPYDSWLDTRCSRYIHLMQEQADEEIIRKTGGPASFNHGPKILWWKHERPDIYERIVVFVQPAAYVAMQLCGLGAGQAFIDKTYLHFSGFADNSQGCWDTRLCERFGIPESKLPRIIDSHAVIGEVTPAAARRCGLRAGIPVIAGCGDTAASFLACGATEEGVAVDVAGTASVFAATTWHFRPDIKFRTLSWARSATPGLWHPYAYINGGGMNLEWFARELGHLSRKSFRGRLNQFDELTATLRPDKTDPFFVPHLGGRMSPSWPQLRGAWAGLTWSHTAGHLYHAVLESVALEYCIYRDVLRSLDAELNIREVRITGGGAKSELWNQLKADALGIPVVQIRGGEGAPMGVALLAGYGVGLFRSLEDAAARWIHCGKVFQPDPQLRFHYRDRLRHYMTLLEHLRDWGNADQEIL